MSLDVWLKIEGEAELSEPRQVIYIRENGQNREISQDEWHTRFPCRQPCVAQVRGGNGIVFSYNITHNLNTMALEANLYDAMWHPELIGATHAIELIVPLAMGLVELLADADRFRQFNPSNGWGTYENLVKFTKEYLEACVEWPTATIGVSR